VATATVATRSPIEVRGDGEHEESGDGVEITPLAGRHRGVVRRDNGGKVRPIGTEAAGMGECGHDSSMVRMTLPNFPGVAK